MRSNGLYGKVPIFTVDECRFGTWEKNLWVKRVEQITPARRWRRYGNVLIVRPRDRDRWRLMAVRGDPYTRSSKHGLEREKMNCGRGWRAHKQTVNFYQYRLIFTTARNKLWHNILLVCVCVCVYTLRVLGACICLPIAPPCRQAPQITHDPSHIHTHTPRG